LEENEKAIKILLVDDERNILDIVKFNLEVEGFEVLTASDGMGALRIVQEVIPDLILCDIMMPELNGLEVCRRLKADGRTNQIPIVMLSAKAQSKDKLDSIDAGADDFVTKPFDFSDLVARIKVNLIRAKQKKDVSPLTGFPGAISIEAEIKKRINRQEAFATLYVDMDNFRPFNEVYGFPMGDKAIKMLADIIDDAVRKVGNLEDFVGHGGGDDFVIISSPELAKQLAIFLIENFDRRITALYREEDLQRGFFIRVDRAGKESYIPITTVSIGIASSEHRRITTHWEVGEIAKETLNYAKSIPGSIFFMDRRAK
jgi:diguanylate cyclase (GGDEF)-like protein